MKEKCKKIAVIILIAILIVVGILCIMLYKKYRTQKQLAEDGYNRAMYDFVASVNNVKNELAKLKVSSNDAYNITTIASVFAKSNAAKANLDLLPFSVENIKNVSMFLTQLSDFSYILMRSVLNGDSIDNYKENIDSIYEKITELSNVTEEIYKDLNASNIKWNELEKVGEEKFKNTNLDEETSSASKIGKTFTDYEGIIYDGAFSNHILDLKPQYLNGKDLSNTEVENIVREKMDVESIEFIEEQNGMLPLYVYRIKLKNIDTIKTVYVTKQDGKIYQIISNREVKNKNIDIEKAKEIALEYINSLGVENIKDTYYLTKDNTVTISFAAVQEDVLVYTDLIKVKVALDNGEILGFEANGYIYNHKERNIEYSKSVDEARSTLYGDLKIESERLCIIPTDAKDEVITYEFKGTVGENTFLVYINANTLSQEKIYIVLETEGGMMTI